MKLLDIFLERAPNKIFISVVFGALAGISYALLIPLVLNSLTEVDEQLPPIYTDVSTFFGIKIAQYEFATLFLATCIFIFFTRSISQILAVRVSMDATAGLRLKIYRKILGTDIKNLERLGPSKLMASLTADVDRIINGAGMIPDLLVNAVTLAGTLGFLLYMNIDVFWLVLVSLAFAVLTFQGPILIANLYFTRARNSFDHLQEGIHGLLYGTKELKLNKEKRERYFDQILHRCEQLVLNDRKLAHSINRAAVSYGDLISFFVIGVIAYIFSNYYPISNQQLIGVVMALLYVIGPVAVVLRTLPQIAIAKVSLRKIDMIMRQLPKEEADERLITLEPWQSVQFHQVVFRYGTTDSGFTLGPVDLSLEKGKITFIIGGNGSGKSTLSKLISLHYRPDDGHISFGNTEVNAQTIESCRNAMSAIFTDYYLFDRILVDVKHADPQILQSYLQKMLLDKKVTIVDGQFSTTSLSDGQRKRLALLCAFIEDKELYLFDEWAADQDPLFKEVFYHSILPDLRAKGKAVVVISHDDKYFDVADKVYVLDEGKIRHQHSDSTAKQDVLVSQ